MEKENNIKGDWNYSYLFQLFSEEFGSFTLILQNNHNRLKGTGVAKRIYSRSSVYCSQEDRRLLSL
jgi:hypothetical protein